MSYTALYRKHRPKTFSDVIGQPHITTTLKNSIIGKRISHAYLFCGARGTGKTSTAKIFARAVNCLSPVNGNPCNQCDICMDILNESIMDIMEIDAASNNSVDNIRQIRDEVVYSPAKCTYKVYIIDEVHMLSTGAFNALLKTLEEPPSHVIFIMATTEPQKIPATIHSRCMRFDFKKISVQSVLQGLENTVQKDNLKVPLEGLEVIARKADGSMRDALSLLDQCSGADEFTDVVDLLGLIGYETLFALSDCIAKQDLDGAMALINDFIMGGGDIITLINDMTEHLRNLLLCKITKNPGQILDTGAENMLKLKEQCKNFTQEKLMNCIKIFSDSQSSIRWVNNQRIILEMSVTKMCNPHLEDSVEALEDRLAYLENKLKNFSLSPEAIQAAITTNGQTAAVPKPEPKPTKPRVLPPKFAEGAVSADEIKEKILKEVKHLGDVCEYLKEAQILNRNNGIIIEAECDIKMKRLSRNNDLIQKAVQEFLGSDVSVKYSFTPKEEKNIYDMDISHIENFDDTNSIIQIEE